MMWQSRYRDYVKNLDTTELVIGSFDMVVYEECKLCDCGRCPGERVAKCREVSDMEKRTAQKKRKVV